MQTCFGPDYLIPKPFDPRLIEKHRTRSRAGGNDQRRRRAPDRRLEAYRQQMARFVYHSGASMKPVFDAAKAAPKRVIYAEGEDERVLRAAQVVVDEGLAFPVLIGRAEIIRQRIEKLRPQAQARRELRGGEHPQRFPLSRGGGWNTTS